MPVLHFPVGRLQAALGKQTDEETLRERLPMFGVPVEDSQGTEWSVEVFPDRPDLLSAELLGRALRAYLGYEPGLTSYEVGQPQETLIVDPSVRDVRPVIVCGAAHGIELDEDGLKALMDLQEDLHWGLGARRRKVSVGIHDARGITGPYTYKGVDPDEISFVPLHGRDEMTMRQMLTEIEQGQDYGHLVEGYDLWPLIVDDEGEILSFPPIINGTTTTLRQGTTDVFVDVTGTDRRACRQVLNIVLSHLAEIGGQLEGVHVAEDDEPLVTPDLSTSQRTVDVDRANRLLGLGLTPDEVVTALERMGHGVTAEGTRVTVEIPAWRSDVLHEVDLIEDIGIGHGMDTFQGSSPEAVTYGQASRTQRFDEQVRRALTGLGYLEVMTLTLTSRWEQTEAIGADEPVVATANPESSEQAVLRRRLLPPLLTLASRNTHRDLPQRLFEVGDVVRPDPDAGAPVNRRRVAGLEMASDAGFTRVKSHVEAVLRALGYTFQESAASRPPFIAGRCAAVTDKASGRVLGHYGEIDPEVIDRFDLGTPCAGFELELGTPMDQATWGPAEEPEHRLQLRET